MGRATLDVLRDSCDIEARLAAIPPGASVRGIYFHSVREELERRGLRDAYDAEFPDTPRSAFTFYPLSEFLVSVAFAGSLVTSPAQVHDGMREIFRGNAKYFAGSLLGRGILRLLSGDPKRQLRQAIKSKRIVSNYGRWSVVDEGPTMIRILHEAEYVWIGSALAGGALGGLEACGIEPTVEVDLTDAYNGTLTFRW